MEPNLICSKLSTLCCTLLSIYDVVYISNKVISYHTSFLSVPSSKRRNRKFPSYMKLVSWIFIQNSVKKKAPGDTLQKIRWSLSSNLKLSGRFAWVKRPKDRMNPNISICLVNCGDQETKVNLVGCFCKACIFFFAVQPTSWQVQHVLLLCRILSCSRRKRWRIHVAKRSCVKSDSDREMYTGNILFSLPNKGLHVGPENHKTDGCLVNIYI